MSRESKESQEPSLQPYRDLLLSGNMQAARGMLEKEMANGAGCDDPHIHPHAIQVSVKQGDNPAKEVHIGKKGPEQGAEEIDGDTAMHIASMTKTFTSAALIKLWDQELTDKKEGKLETERFPEGMETKLSTFMVDLKEKFPEAKASLEKMETYDHFEQVTLRDLLQHTHGFGAKDARKTREEQIEDPTRSYSCAEIISDLVRDPAKDQHGTFRYGATGTDLSGMIMELVTGKDYDKALRDLVLNPLELKNTHTLSEASDLYEKGNAATACSWTSKERLKHSTGDEIPQSGAIDNNISSNGRADASLKSCPNDCHTFLRAYLSQDEDVSMFNNPEVRSVLNPENRRKTKDGVDYDYGVGEFKDWNTGKVLGYGHNGDGTGFATDFAYDPKTDSSFYYAVAGENLSFELAYEIAAKANPDKKIDLKKDVEPIRDQLVKQYSFEEMYRDPEGLVEKEVTRKLEKTGLGTPQESKKQEQTPKELGAQLAVSGVTMGEASGSTRAPSTGGEQQGKDKGGELGS